MWMKLALWQHLSKKLVDSNWAPAALFSSAKAAVTAGGPGGRDRTLAVKSRKITKKSVFFFVKKKKIPNIFFSFAYIF